LSAEHTGTGWQKAVAPPSPGSRPRGLPPRTVPVRVPDDVAKSLTTTARMRRTTPANLMREAWDWWVASHKDELLGQIDEFRREVESR
jgi:hypothetical protein